MTPQDKVVSDKINNHEELCRDADKIAKNISGKWVTENTAILITHGIGNQNPLETIDVFARGLINSYKIHNREPGFDYKTGIKIEHRMAKKDASNKSYTWFDNYIRISNGSYPGLYIDIYEYYWANLTENKTNFTNVMRWLRQVVRGAKNHYHAKQNAKLSAQYNEDSPFVKKGKGFNYTSYWFFINIVGSLTFLYSLLANGLITVFKWIPVIGNPLSQLVESFVGEQMISFANILGDITIYNDVNERSEFYCIRKDILNGAVKAIQYLVESDNGVPPYDHIIIAGHSLGSQISFDAINRITHLTGLNEMKSFNPGGFLKNGKEDTPEKTNINQILRTFITFGSPLDKIAFFLREQTPQNEYIRQQLQKNFHCFKQRDWTEVDSSLAINIDPPFKRIFDDIKWVNYYDNNDLVSGALDYYHKLTNVSCGFTKKKLRFTHSDYWINQEFFGDVWKNILAGEAAR